MHTLRTLHIPSHLPTPHRHTQKCNSLRPCACLCGACREQLIGMTDVTRTHFQKLVDEFEQGVDAAMRGYSREIAFAGAGV